MNEYLQLKKDRQLNRWLMVHNQIKARIDQLPDNSPVVYVYYFILNEAPMRSELLKEINGSQLLAPLLKQKMLAKLDRQSPEQIDAMISQFFDFLNSVRSEQRQ